MLKIALIFCRIDDVFADYTAGVFSIFESNPPLGLAAVGTVAANRGHEVKIFDQLLHRYSQAELIEAIEEFRPDLVGFSCTSLNIDNSIACGNRLKEKQSCIVCAGGIHITLCTEDVSEKNVFDFLISGEGEPVFQAVLEKLEGNEGLETLEMMGLRLKGSALDCGDSILEDISQPMIDRKTMALDLYRNKGALLDETPCYAVFSSRGCPFTCRFCSKPDYFKVYRQRPVEEVIKELHALVEDYGAKAISFREDNFTVDIQRIIQFCHAMISHFGGKLHWECESRADLNKDILELMYSAGCRGIWCGVETIVPRWSKWINKGLEKNTVIKFYNDCEDVGIKTGALFMFGFPDQTREEIREDIEFAAGLPTVFSAFQCLAIFPGSPLTSYYEEHPELCHKVTEHVFLTNTRGKSWKEMIDLEKEINEKIKSVRLVYRDE